MSSFILRQWVPIEEETPPEDTYVLLSCANYTGLLIGRYEDGAFYEGDSDEPLSRLDIYIDAWMTLPPRYSEMEEDDGAEVGF